MDRGVANHHIGRIAPRWPGSFDGLVREA